MVDVCAWCVQDKGVQNAAVQVSGLELGGLVGSLSSGAISDHLVRNNDGSRGNVGLRVQVSTLSPAASPPYLLLTQTPCLCGCAPFHGLECAGN